MAIEEQQTELSWEEAVGRFLRDNPDYFQRNPDLLRQLEIPHADAGKAVSLIERQVIELRRDNGALEDQLHQLVDNATENDVLAGQLHRFIIDLMLAGDLRQVIELATEGLKTRFNLDTVVLKLFGDTGEGQPPCFIAADEPTIKQISSQVQSGQTVCGIRFSPEETAILFEDGEVPGGSLALIPVRSSTLMGLLTIGSNDPGRFVSDMATTYLDRIGELIGVAVLRLNHDH